MNGPSLRVAIVVESITPGRIRTCDHRFRKPMLYPLSYGGPCALNSKRVARVEQETRQRGWGGHVRDQTKPDAP